MIFLVTQTTNSSFISSDGGKDYENLAQATSEAVEGSLMIAIDEIRAGGTVSSLDVILKDLDGHQHRRMAIAVSIAPLYSPREQEGVTDLQA